MNNKQAFTLIELLVVVLIIGILAAVALPQYQKAVIKSRYATMKQLVDTMMKAEEVYFLATGQWGSFDQLDLSLPENTISQTPNLFSYKWGYCDTGNFAIACRNNDIGMGYQKYHDNSPSYFKGKSACIALSTNEKALTNQLCKQETQTTVPSVKTDGYWFWVYK